MDRSRKPLLLFVFVAFYIVLQFGWWAWLLLSKDQELFLLQQQLLAEGLSPIVAVKLPEHARWMVVGEGSVFLLLVMFGLAIIYRTVRHELALARQQRGFLLAASHELRTPIAGLKLHLGTLQRTGLSAEQREALSDRAQTEVERLRSLTEKILLATRLDSAQVPLTRSTIDVAVQLRSITDRARASYGRERTIITKATEPLPLNTDPDAFTSVAENLLENACKYSPVGTSIHVEALVNGDRCDLIVSDEGIGIAENDRPRIFEKFFRSGSEETRNAKGTGLGLYIAHRLMTGLGGRIEHRPRVPQGSIFVASFPIR